ncbi:MAG: hypothetical protein QHH27_01620 [Clostridia bacterium]|jgi:uncharacterized protein YwgA|nr:hypothetical protein [Clostridia bacterium]MDH7572236.1 hypothetical protein [Clostridia bacterium]
MGERLRRLGAVAQAVCAGTERGLPVGHTLLQKLFYFLEHGKGRDLGYRYRLYHYGPYCQEVWADLSYLEDVGAVSIRGGPNGYGYHIYAREDIKGLVSFADEDLRKQVNSLVEFLGGRSARELECLATTHYVYKELRRARQDSAPAWETVMQGVRALKPHLSEDEVRAAWQALQEKGLL